MLVPPADWATRTSEPPSGADPDRPPYESGAAAVRGGESFRGWTRTSDDKGQGLAGDNRRPTRNRYGRRDSNSHTRGVWARGLCRWTTPAEPEESRPSGRHSAVDRGASPRRSPAVGAPSRGQLSPPLCPWGRQGAPSCQQHAHIARPGTPFKTDTAIPAPCVRREGNDPPQPGVRARCSAD